MDTQLHSQRIGDSAAAVDLAASVNLTPRATGQRLTLDAATTRIGRSHLVHGPGLQSEQDPSTQDPSTQGPFAQGPAGQTLEEFVYRHGQYSDAYLATEPGRSCFWSRSCRGMISYVQRGRYVLAGGGLFASSDHREDLLGEFLEATSRHKLHVAFYNICDEALPVFRKFDFQVTKWGEEPIIDLGSCTWGGKPFEWVRRQSNYCLRKGLVAFEVHPDRLEPRQWSRTLAELKTVSAQSLSHKPQIAPIRFFEGQIDSHTLGLRRLFIARSTFGIGRVEGFVVCNPLRNGSAWATELYRRRTDSVRGTMAFLIHDVLKTLQSEGVRQVGLCLDPGLRCAAPLPGDSAFVRHMMQIGDRRLSLVFDVAGLRHFKTRFRPRYENRYICARPKASLGSTLAFVQVSGLFSLSPVKLARVCADRIRKRASRQSLSSGQ